MTLSSSDLCFRNSFPLKYSVRISQILDNRSRDKSEYNTQHSEAIHLQSILNSRTTRFNRIHSDTINSCRAGLPYDGSEVLILVAVKSSILWYTTPHCPVKVNRHFKGTCRKEIAAYCLLHAGLLLDLLFDPQYGGNRFLRNVG
jgi:hypothetical protein